MLRTNWIHGSTMWRIGSYQAMRKATGIAVIKARPKPMSTRDSEAQTCSRRMPLSILLTKAAQTSVGGAKTGPGSWLDAKRPQRDGAGE